MNNLTNISISDLTKFNAPTRMDAGVYYRTVCEQLNTYFIRTGIILVILYVFICWFNWWFFNYGYKKLNYDSSKGFGKFIGNLDNRDTRIYWDIFIKEKLTKLLVCYIVVVIYFNWIY